MLDRNWTDTLKLGEGGKKCMQGEESLTDLSEDCLTLTVLVPGMIISSLRSSHVHNPLSWFCKAGFLVCVNKLIDCMLRIIVCNVYSAVFSNVCACEN